MYIYAWRADGFIFGVHIYTWRADGFIFGVYIDTWRAVGYMVCGWDCRVMCDEKFFAFVVNMHFKILKCICYLEYIWRGKIMVL
jgi:hypothetical protein